MEPGKDDEFTNVDGEIDALIPVVDKIVKELNPGIFSFLIHSNPSALTELCGGLYSA